jgi:hypothetical protein
MAEVVNLDALVPREDFLATEGPEGGESGKPVASLTDLRKGENFNLTLRKPDFQRETAAWSPEAVCDFIKAFIDGDLIPSVICWQSPARLSFVIDGAHRISAILAWLLDDYGDGEESIKFYDNRIPDQQRKIARKTKALVDKTIGPYKDYQAEAKNPGSNPTLESRVRALAHSQIPLLWIKGADSKKAEKAFLMINQSAVQIDPTELKILNARFKPNAIASRAIVRNASGHKYWKDFSVPAQAEIESLAQTIYKALYSPPLVPPIRTIELPVAGHGYGSQTLPLIFDFVNIANGIPVVDASKIKQKDLRLADQESPTESETIETMKKAEKLTRRITGTHPSSLGLHPAVYFYAANGRHQPTAVLAMAALVKELDEKDRFLEFTKVRADFENFLIQHKGFINQLTTRHGSMAKGYRQMKDYFLKLVDLFVQGHASDEVRRLMQEQYPRLVDETPTESLKSKDFSQDLKQWKFLSDALSRALRCHLCGALIDHKAMELDHVVDKKDGGLGAGKNAEWAHPYCNSTYKPHLTSKS